MRCPYCGNPDTKVIDSRPAEDKCSIRRRRSCDECGRRFTTYEKVETIPLIVIKKDNNREQYERSKIEQGILGRFQRRQYSRPLMRLSWRFLTGKRKKFPAVRSERLLWRNSKIWILWHM